jgi:hypothetical protein
MPICGMRYPWRLRDEGERLKLQCHWLVATCGLVGLSMFCLAMAWVLLLLLDWPPRSMWPGAYPVVGASLLGQVFHVYRLNWGSFELCRDQIGGWGHLAVGGWPQTRNIVFPLSAVRCVLVIRNPPRSRRPGESLGLRLADDEGRVRDITVCTCSPARARAWAAEVADWLGVELSSADFKRRRRKAKIPAAPSQPHGLGDREVRRAILVGDLRVGGPPSCNRFRLRADGRFLRLGPATGGSHWPAVLASGCSGLIAVAAALSELPSNPVLGLCTFLVGLFFIALSAYAYPRGPSWLFDEVERRIRWRKGWLGKHALRFGDVEAVQSLDFSQDSDAREPFELNLVLRSGRRLNVVSHTTRAFVRDAGRRIAEFLDVPWIDHTAEADADAGGQP